MEWGQGHRIGTKKGKDGKPWERKLQKKSQPPCSKAAPWFPRAGLSVLGRQESSGLAFGGVVLESSKPIWWLVTPLGMQFPLLGTFGEVSSWHSGDALVQRRSSFQEGFARWDGLTWDSKPLGFSTAIQMQALPADYGSFPEWLSSCVWKNFLGLEKGRGGADTEQPWEGSVWGWISQARRKVFGFPWSMGRHWSWY